MFDRKGSNSGRVIAGILIIVFGIFLLLGNMDLIDSEMTPGLIFAVLGILIMFNSRKKMLGVIFFFIGIAIILGNLPWVNHRLIFPALLILFGVYIIFRNRVRHNRPIIAGHEMGVGNPPPTNQNYAGGYASSSSENLNQDVLDEIAVFGGGHKTFYTDQFKGGNLTAVFGGYEIDLSNCKLANGENVLDVLAVFGGTEIYVPRDWNIIINVTPLFGGFSNKIRRDPNWVPDPSKVLVIKGLVLFGGGELKSY